VNLKDPDAVIKLRGRGEEDAQEVSSQNA